MSWGAVVAVGVMVTIILAIILIGVVLLVTAYNYLDNRQVQKLNDRHKKVGRK